MPRWTQIFNEGPSAPRGTLPLLSSRRHTTDTSHPHCGDQVTRVTRKHITGSRPSRDMSHLVASQPLMQPIGSCRRGIRRGDGDREVRSGATRGVCRSLGGRRSSAPDRGAVTPSRFRCLKRRGQASGWNRRHHVSKSEFSANAASASRPALSIMYCHMCTVLDLITAAMNSRVGGSNGRVTGSDHA